MPRLRAMEALWWYDVLTVANEWCSPEHRKAMLTRWSEIASGKDPSYDSLGRKLLRGSKEVMAWLIKEADFVNQDGRLH